MMHLRRRSAKEARWTAIVGLVLALGSWQLEKAAAQSASAAPSSPAPVPPAAQPAPPKPPPVPAQLPERSKLHLFLLAGQSNMAGRGDVEPADREPIAHVLALDASGRWVAATDPIHWDKPIAGVGPARSFAVRYLASHPGVSVGLIPAACGGSPIASWVPGQFYEGTHSHPYDDAIARARIGLKDGTLKGILWHQGESDRTPELAPRYEAALTALIARFRADLGAPRVPVLIGQVGEFVGGEAWGEPARLVDRAQRAVAARVPFTAFVPAHGLASKADHLHFDAPAMREFGRRYAVAFEALAAGVRGDDTSPSTPGLAPR